MRYFLVTGCLLFGLATHAQSSFNIGYAQYFGNAKEFNRVIYLYNQTGAFDKEMNYLRFARGPAFTYHAGDENMAFEMKWHNRHTKLHSKWHDINNVDYRRDIKFRQNAMAFNFIIKNDGFYYGFGFDIGNWKAWTRRGTTDEIGSLDWEVVFIDKDWHSWGSLTWLLTTQASFTGILGYEAGPVGCRLTYQYQGMTKYLDHLDNYLVGRDIGNSHLEGRFNNLGLELYFKIGGND